MQINLPKMNTGKKIKQIRETNKLTQDKFAESINISRGSLSQIESERANATVEILKNIINTYNLDANYFFKDNEELNVLPNIPPNTPPNDNLNIKNDKINNKSIGFFNEAAWNSCIEKANELYEIHEAILKVLNITKVGTMITLSSKEIEVLNSFKEIGYDRLMKLSFDGLLKKNTDFEMFNYENLLNEINISINIANKMLLNYIDEAQFAVFNDTDKRPYLIYAENFAESEEI